MAKFTFVLKNVFSESVSIEIAEGSSLSNAYDNILPEDKSYHDEWVMLAAFKGHHKDISEEEL